MIIYKKTTETFYDGRMKETVAKTTTVYFLGIPIYKGTYKTLLDESQTFHVNRKLG